MAFWEAISQKKAKHKIVLFSAFGLTLQSTATEHDNIIMSLFVGQHCVRPYYDAKPSRDLASSSIISSIND